MKSAVIAFLLACAGYASAQTMAAVSQTGGVLGNAASSMGSISEDGRYVVFQSSATNLVAGDANGADDVFLRDVSAGTTEIISVGTTVNNVSPAGNMASNFADVSGDGERVVFVSGSTTFFMGANGFTQIYVRDRDDQTTELISRASGANGLQGDANSILPSISEDGDIVGFTTLSTNLGASAAAFQVVVRDTDDDTTTLASRADGAAGAVGNMPSFGGVLSGSGRYIAFTSQATNLIPAGQGQNTAATASDVYVRDLDDDSTTLVSVAAAGGVNNGAPGSGVAPLGVSYDGRYIAFQSSVGLVAQDTNGMNDIYVRDVEDGVTTLISVGPAGVLGDGPSASPDISGDGRFVVFQSSATNFVAGDTNAADDIFLHDRDTGITTRISTDMNGVQGTGAMGVTAATAPRISHDGSLVVFDSQFTNLVMGDANGVQDVFLAVGDPASVGGGYFAAMP